MANKRKTTTAIVAGVTAVVLLLGGTFAWTSISQQAKNEAIVDINPGGRLHDDFNGANKDVYVENFGDNQTGVPIYARIRLDQYMEIGQEAGKNKEADNRNVKTLIGTDIDDVSTWVTYIPGDLTDTSKVQANEHWTWTMGNDDSNLPYYMPTFNKNKDSLLADINGTYEGTTEGDIVHYDDYVFYDASSVPVMKDATYDWDEDTAEDYATSTRDENAPIDSADVLLKEEEHTATQITKTAQVILMENWDGTTGDFWVYDTDGWAYWANAIQPGETTGLLLDGITLSKTPDDNYYYGINVVGQFATASDWTMLYAPAVDGGGESMTDAAKELMTKITGTVADDGGNGDENPPAEVPTYYSMNVDYPLKSGTVVNLGVTDYTDETPDDTVSYYIINKVNNPNGGSATVLEAKDNMKVVPIVFVSGGGLITQTMYYYAEPFANSTAVTTNAAVEGVTFVAMDGDTVVAYSCTKVYDDTVHTYLGMGNYEHYVEGVDQPQYTGCLVFESVANPGNYCTLGDANIGVDGDDVFQVTTGVTEAAEDAGYDYDVTTITTTDCTCTAGN